jgi:hypothetical protein
MTAGWLEAMPATAWGAIGAVAGSLVSLLAVVLTLRHTRKLQKNQLAHDATERGRERQMAWRRDVYMEGVESIARLAGLLPRMADLNTSDTELARISQVRFR